MDLSRRTSRNRTMVVATMLLTFGLGCLCLPTGITPTSTPVRSTSTFLPTSTSQPPLPPATDTPVIGSARLNSDGPWLLIESDQGLWALNPDGSGLTQLTTVDYWHGDLQDSIEPGGSQVAFISPGNYDFHHMALNILSLPSEKVIKITDLTSAQTETYADSGPGDTGFEALRAIGEQRSYAWSPDGFKLAFVGAMDGPSAELYIYNEHLYQIKRVSQDADQDFAPSWSPDGQHILYLEAAGFGTGAGMAMSGVWVANGDGSNATELYQTKSSGEDIDGWLNDTTALLDTWNIVCGPGKLRLYDVVSRKQTMLNDGCISSAAASGGLGAAIFSNDSGLYMLTSDNPQPVQVSQEPNARIDPWGPDDYVFTARFDGGLLATFGPGSYDHQVSPVTAPAGPSLLPYDIADVAEYGAIWGWTSQNPAQPGAWITGPGVEIGQIYPGAARFPAWDPHNNLLFFALSESGGYDIYLTTFDAHYTDLNNVNHLDANVNSVIWLGPR